MELEQGLESDSQRNMSAEESELLSPKNIPKKYLQQQQYLSNGFHVFVTTGRFTEDTGSLLSPFWPNNYFNSESCFYDVMSGPCQNILLSRYQLTCYAVNQIMSVLQGPRRQKGFFDLS